MQGVISSPHLSTDPVDKGCIIFVDLILPMGWVESPKFLCEFPETLTDVAHAPVDTDLLFLSYATISKISSDGPFPPTH